MTAQRTIEVQPFTLHDLVERSYLFVPVSVPGYWSRDPITVSARIEYDFSASSKAAEAAGDKSLNTLEDHAVHTLDVTIAHSSGGRDTDEIADDATAALQFAEGLRQAALVARTLRSQEAEILRMHAEKQAVLRAERDGNTQEADRFRRQLATLKRAEHLITTKRGPMGTVHTCTVCGYYVFAPRGNRFLSTRAYGAMRTHVSKEHKADLQQLEQRA